MKYKIVKKKKLKKNIKKLGLSKDSLGLLLKRKKFTMLNNIFLITLIKVIS